MVSLRFSAIFSYFLLVIVLFLFAKTMYGTSFVDDPNFWVYVSKFENHTDYEYLVSRACSPSPYEDDLEWEFVLRLLSFDKENLSDNVGSYSVLLRDPQGLGCLIKFEPTDKDKEKGAQTFFVKTGIKSSGNCFYDWGNGPYDILISHINLFLIDNNQILYENDNYSIGRVRYCGYQDTYLKCVIYKDGLKFMPWHRAEVLDSEPCKIEKLEEENE